MKKLLSSYMIPKKKEPRKQNCHENFENTNVFTYRLKRL